jgi:hypothetical protein
VLILYCMVMNLTFAGPERGKYRPFREHHRTCDDEPGEPEKSEKRENENEKPEQE